MPYQSDIDICNLALAALGVNPITSFADGTRQAQSCRMWYPRARDALLRSHPWNFARKQQPLPISAIVPLQLAFAPDPWYQTEIIWDLAYQLPTDCIRVYRAAPYQYHYRIIGTTLYTDAPSASVNNGSFVGAQPGVGLPPLNQTVPPTAVGIEYVSSNVDTNLFDPMFVEALAMRLASRLCLALNGTVQTKAQLDAEADKMTQEAWFADGAENWPDGLYDDTLTDVRNQTDGWLGGVQ